MFIVWGKRAVSRKVGYVADYCPICRQVRPFLLKRIGMAGHLYYITVSEGDLVCHERTCEVCHTVYETEIRQYKSVSKKLQDLAVLKNETFPNVEMAWGEQLVLEDQVKRNAGFMSPDERHAMIRNSFLWLARMTEDRFARAHVDKDILIALLAFFIAPSFLALALSKILPLEPSESLMAAYAIALVYLVVQVAQAGKRFFKRIIIPNLVRTLTPIRPNQHEVDAVLQEIKQQNLKIGTKMPVKDLHDALFAPPGAVK